MSWREAGICEKCRHKEFIDNTTHLCPKCEKMVENTLEEESYLILFKTTKDVLDRQTKVLQNTDGSITLSENIIFKIDEYIYLRTTISTVRRTEAQTIKEYYETRKQKQKKHKKRGK